MTIHVPRRGSKRSWVLLWLFVVFSVVAVATNYFGLQPIP